MGWPPSETFAAIYRARRARIIAERLRSAGIGYEQARLLTPYSLTARQWEQVLGTDPETGVQYHRPSKATLGQACVILHYLWGD